MMRRLQSLAAALAMAALLAATAARAAEPAPPQGKVVTVYMIGDSTMANKPGKAQENPERGWGQNFGQFFGPGVKVDNHAMDGRSSKSFRDEGRWTPIEQQLQPGDYVIIQFGHNDEKTDAARHTDPYTSFKENLKRYASEARAKGATPILATPIARRVFDEKTGALTDTHGEYTSATRQAARELKATLLDLNAATTALIKELGPEASERLFLHFGPGVFKMYAQGREDNTHLSDFGATEVGRLAAAKLRAAHDPLARLLKADSAPELPGAKEKTYHEKLRPAFHFTAKRGWLNDPNGLVYYNGAYHLFFQYNPYGVKWGNMHWGHATSPDLIHWTEGPLALAPDVHGTNFSGSAVVDWKNSAGLQQGAEKTLVALYTGAPDKHTFGPREYTQCLAYSNDAGKTWKKYEKNPVLGNLAPGNRDPRVFWHEPSQQWVMALYLDKFDFAIFGSKDLKAWKELSRLSVQGFRECPELFELPVYGEGEQKTGEKKWIFYAADGNYLVGRFDGVKFTAETPSLRQDWGRNFYASQTYSDIPAEDGRRIQIGWMRGGEHRGMPFNQQMSIPCELRLLRTPAGPRLARRPVAEVELLHAKSSGSWRDAALAPAAESVIRMDGDVFDIRAEFDLGKAKEVGLVVCGEKVAYDVKSKTLKCLGGAAPLEPVKNRIAIRVIVDRTSIEAFSADGLASLTSHFIPKDGAKGLTAYAEGGEARVASMEAHGMRSAWGDQETYESAIQRFERDDAQRQHNPDEILFVGSSTFTMWRSLPEDMKPLPAVNRGFGGSQMMHAAMYVNRVVLPNKPKTIVVYEGPNDVTSGKTPEQVIVDAMNFVAQVHRYLPATKIYFVAIRPSISRAYLRATEVRTNELLKAYAAGDKRLAFIDVCPVMYDQQGLLLQDIFIADKLHLNRKGYELLFPVIKKRLMDDLGLSAREVVAPSAR